MTTREMTSEYRLAQWAEKIREQKNSGQNIRQWCELNGIDRQRYFYWQRKLRQAACNQLPGMQMGNGPTAMCVAPGFAQVQVVEAAVPTAPKPALSGQMRLEVGSVRLIADAAYPPEQLARLVRELAGIC